VPVERIAVGSTTKLVAAPLGSIARDVVDRWPESGRIFATPPDAQRDPS
jgi:hypothetical protein